MFRMGILSLLMAQALTTPAPSAAPLKTITHITAKAECTVLHDVVLPFTVVEKQNNERLKAIGKDLAASRAWPTDPMYHDPRFYASSINGEKLIESGKMRQQAADMFDAFVAIEKRLAQSYHDFPAGRDPKADELRARVDNVIKLQYARAEQYDQMALGVQERLIDPRSADLIQAYFNGPFKGNPLSNGVPDFSSPQPDDPTPAAFLHPQMPTASADALDLRSVLDLPSAYIDQAMTVQEVALVKPALDAVDTCSPPVQKP